jgi:hypothetical protein
VDPCLFSCLTFACRRQVMMQSESLFLYRYTLLLALSFLQEQVTSQLNMTHQCPICLKTFSSQSSLWNHTGTTNPRLPSCHPRVCRKCNQTLCSQRAMEQHCEALSHDTMFNWDVYNRKFESKQAIVQHEASPSHASLLAQASPLVSAAGATPYAERVSYLQAYGASYRF